MPFQFPSKSNSLAFSNLKLAALLSNLKRKLVKRAQSSNHITMLSIMLSFDNKISLSVEIKPRVFPLNFKHENSFAFTVSTCSTDTQA